MERIDSIIVKIGLESDIPPKINHRYRIKVGSLKVCEIDGIIGFIDQGVRGDIRTEFLTEEVMDIIKDFELDKVILERV